MRPSVLILALSFWGIVVGPSQLWADDLESPVSKSSAWGIGASVRYSRVSKRLQKVFLDDTPGRTFLQPGATLEFSRRSSTGIEIIIGFGYDRFRPRDGYYLEKGGEPTTPGKVDYVDFDKFSWATVELSVVGHLRLHKLLALRYGAGIGVGYLLGDVRKTDALCTGPDLQTQCMHPDPNAMEIDQPANLPPVLPVLNLVAGIQLRPFDFLSLNLDAGLHTAPYVGAGATFYLW